MVQTNLEALFEKTRVDFDISFACAKAIKSLLLKEHAESFAKNSHHLMLIMMLPIHLLGEYLTYERIAFEMSKIGEFSNPRKAKLDILQDLDEANYSEMITQHVQKFARKALTKPDSNFVKGLNSLLYLAVTSAWTNFEALATDVWETATNERPRSLGKRVYTSTNMRPENYPFDFNTVVPTDKVGTYAMEHEHHRFGSHGSMAKAYRAIFEIGGTDVTGIQSIFAESALKKLAADRCVIVHRGGRIDDDYINRIGSPLKCGDRLVLDTTSVSEAMNASISCGCRLAEEVDKWLVANPN